MFVFSSTLEMLALGGYYFVSVHERIILALKKRGPVPVSARINGRITLTASLSPAGGGRRYLRLNTDIRRAAKIEVGDLVKVAISVLTRPLRIIIPADLKEELSSEGVLESFKSFPAGKQ